MSAAYPHKLSWRQVRYFKENCVLLSLFDDSKGYTPELGSCNWPSQLAFQSWTGHTCVDEDEAVRGILSHQFLQELNACHRCKTPEPLCERLRLIALGRNQMTHQLFVLLPNIAICWAEFRNGQTRNDHDTTYVCSFETDTVTKWLLGKVLLPRVCNWKVS